MATLSTWLYKNVSDTIILAPGVCETGFGIKIDDVLKHSGYEYQHPNWGEQNGLLIKISLDMYTYDYRYWKKSEFCTKTSTSHILLQSFRSQIWISDCEA
jgi:hypothetical protein